jgi:long-chain acyl-CoA synthetase
MPKGIDIYKENKNTIIKGLQYYEPRTVNNLKELLEKSSKKFNNKTAFKYKNKKGDIIEKSYSNFYNDVNALGSSLISMGMKGSKISILSENRYEWGLSYLSIVNGTGVSVPLDKYLPPIEIETLVKRAGIEAIIYSPSFQESIEKIASQKTTLKYFICMENNPNESDERFLSLPKLIDKGNKLIEEDYKDFTDAKINEEEMSVLLFTSGTTNQAKGVMLSHSNIASNITSLTTIIKIYPDDVHLSLLPLHHTFENTIGFLFMIHSGICIAFNDGIKHLAKNLKEYNVSVIVAVPAIFEVIYKKLKEGIEKSGKKNLVNNLIKLTDILSKMGINIKKYVFKSIIKNISPKLRILITGAAPLDKEIIKGFSDIGLTTLQGLGLTECSPVIAATNDFINKPGTVGYPLMGVELYIDSPDENGIGEIVVRGKNIMLGYYENEEETKEVLTSDKWFKTGDLGTMDSEYYLTVTGRVKSMIVLASGKKAFPEEFEVLLNNNDEIKESYVWGYQKSENDVQICAKIVLDKDFLENTDYKSNKEISEKIKLIIKEINNRLPRYKMIRYFILTYEELIKTTTLKIKRPLENESLNKILKAANVDMRKISGEFIENLRF